MAGIPAQMDTNNMKLVADLEIEMLSDMYNRMTSSCQKKCIAPKYRESDLSKGESVCIDRCVGKFMDVYEKIGKKLTAASMQEEQIMKKLQENQKEVATN